MGRFLVCLFVVVMQNHFLHLIKINLDIFRNHYAQVVKREMSGEIKILYDFELIAV